MSERYRLYYLACLADDAQMYDDLVKLMKALTRLGPQLNSREFVLLCRSMQIKINKLRFSWKVVKEKMKVLQEENSQNGGVTPANTVVTVGGFVTNTQNNSTTTTSNHNNNNVRSMEYRIAETYLHQIENEMRDFCLDNVEVFEQFILPKASSYDILVLSLRVMADNYRYLAHITSGDDKTMLAGKAESFYRNAIEQATTALRPSHPARLRVFLNYSLFLYKVVNQRNSAIELTKQSFADAFNDFAYVRPFDLVEVTGIMQLLRSNLEIWTNQQPRTNTISIEEQGQGDGIHVG